MANQKLQFSVTVPPVKGVSAERWLEYIKDAVLSWAGQFEPVDGGCTCGMEVHAADCRANEPGAGDPLGPPMDWQKLVEVRRMR